MPEPIERGAPATPILRTTPSGGVLKLSHHSSIETCGVCGRSEPIGVAYATDAGVQLDTGVCAGLYGRSARDPDGPSSRRRRRPGRGPSVMTADTKYMLEIHRPRGPRPRACRVCGCTDHDACVVDVGQQARGRPPVNPAAFYERHVDRGHCYWVGEPGDICSRCHSETRPTMRQIHELERIVARLGKVSVLYVTIGHGLEILIEDRPNLVTLQP
jgi:hypothetical protein